MKFAIATILSLIAVSTKGAASPTAAGIKSGAADVFTAEPIKTAKGETSNNATAITDCDDKKCLLDSAWNGKKVLVGLRFTDKLQTLNPGKAADEEGVFAIYSKVGANSNKRAYDGVHILAQHHVAQHVTDELYDYLASISTSGENAKFLKQSYITLPFIENLNVLQELVFESKNLFAKVFVYLKDEDVNNELAEVFLNAPNDDVEIVATQATAEEICKRNGTLTINSVKQHPANAAFNFTTYLPICKSASK